MLDLIKAAATALIANPREQALSYARTVLGVALGALALGALAAQFNIGLPDVAVQTLALAAVVVAAARHVIAFLDPTNSAFGIARK